MDRIKKNERLLLNLLDEYRPRFTIQDGTETILVSDTKSGYYALVCHGWTDKDEFIHYAIFAFRIKDGKIWILRNTTEIEIAEELRRRGVDRSDIIIGFIPERHRPYTDFAVA